jgi:hypothetical protein
MTKDLALAIDGSETAYGIHRQQLKATDRFIAGKKHAAPFTLRTVENLDPEFHPFMRLPYDVKYAILKEIVPAPSSGARGSGSSSHPSPTRETQTCVASACWWR